MLVIDTSAAIPFVLPDESGNRVDDVLDALHEGNCIAPALFAWELANVIWKTRRSGRMDDAQLAMAANCASDLEIAFDADGQSLAIGPVLDLAVRHSLTVYDASYLELAVRRSASLASFDRALRAAALAEGVKVIPAP